MKQVIIGRNCHIENKAFENGIIILNGADVHLSNVRVSERGIEVKEKSKLSMENSIIYTVETGIKVDSDCTLGKIQTNEFRGIKSGIKFNGAGAIMEEENSISDNIFVIDEPGEAVAITTGLNIKNSRNPIADISKLARKICLMNNEALVRGYGVFSDIITTIFRVYCSEELEEALSGCSTGNIIRLSGDNFFGNIVVDKEITIIGTSMDKTVIVPHNDLKKDAIEYGIRIKSGNVCIENLCIDGRNYKFRDGIRYDNGIFHNNEFKCLCIKNTARRGISIWPEDTKCTIIKECLFENIKEHQGIYFSGSGNIKDCSFNNVKSPIEIGGEKQNVQIY